MLLLGLTEFNDYNAALFNIRGRSLNNFVYWSAQIVGSISIGLLLDNRRFNRRARAFAGWLVLFGMVWLVHIWGYLYQRSVSLLIRSLHVFVDGNIMTGLTPANL